MEMLCQQVNINGRKRTRYSSQDLLNEMLRGVVALHKLNREVQVGKDCFVKEKEKLVSLKTNPVKIPLCVQSKLLCNPLEPGNNVQAATSFSLALHHDDMDANDDIDEVLDPRCGYIRIQIGQNCPIYNETSAL